MNSLLKGIFERRSVRKYTSKEVSESLVRDILEAGMAAPSAVADDPWRFIVVRNPSTLEQLADGLPNGPMLRKTSLAIVVCGDIEKAHDRLESYMIQDCSACIENMLLAASMLGLGACWLGVHPRPDRLKHVKSMFALPSNIVPIAAISIGHPGEHPKARTRYTDKSVHFEKW